MAGGKQTPRQKMINLMYLVFIAMMALNMSKEVLSAFGMINEELTETTETTAERNNALMADLALKADEAPEKYGTVSQQAEEVDQLSEEFFTYIESLKNTMLADIPEEERRDYESMDKSSVLDEYLFSSGVANKNGQEFLARIDAYREGIINIIGEDHPVAGDVRRKFTTEKVETREGTKQDWLNYHFEGYPLIASLTKLSNFQSSIETIESEILSRMLSGQLQSEVSMTNYSTLLQTPKSAYYQGETFDGAIVLGRTDETTKPNRVELSLDGRQLDEDDFEIQGGRVVLNVPAGNAGNHKIEGQLIFEEGGEETVVEVNQEFAVIPKPNSAVISADKMNVLYRGVDNPITISMPGVPDNNINANAPGLRKVGSGQYVMNVTTLQAREVKINVTGTIDGESYPSSQTFRVKDIPSPVGTVRGESGAISMQRNALEISDIGASLPDFDFDLDLRVTGFKFKVQGQPTVQVNGSKLDGQAKAALRRAGRGETVQIFDIDARLVGNSGYNLKKISPVFIELTN